MQVLIATFNQVWTSGLLVDEIYHGIVALPFAALLYYKTKNAKVSVVPLIVVYLIDLDHLIDYWSFHGFRFNPVEFFKGEYFIITGKGKVPLHSIEIAAILTYFTYKRGWNSYIAGIQMGMIAHIVWDVFTINSLHFYFLLYRAQNGFLIP